MSNPHLIKNYIADGAIGQYLVVKMGAADGKVAQASAATDLSVGVCCQPGGAADGERVDIVRSGLVEVQYGGTVARGKKLTANSAGKVVEAAPSAGANVHIIGIAEVSGVANDIVYLMIAPSVMQG